MSASSSLTISESPADSGRRTDRRGAGKHLFAASAAIRFVSKNGFSGVDPEILSAISCHTTLKAQYSRLDLIVFLADKSNGIAKIKHLS